MELKISSHAINQFREQTKSPDQQKLSIDKIKNIILSWWEIGKPQHTSQYGFILKFMKYGEEDAEHRKTNGWIITRVDDTIITVHLKTLQEKRKDKQRRLKQNQRKRRKKRR